MKKKFRIKKWVVVALMLVCLIGIITSSSKLIFRKISMDKNNAIKEEINNSIQIINNEKKDEETGEVTIEEKYVIDFNNLKSQNEDTVGYLKIKNSSIEYVIVKANNNDYYLNHNFRKEYNSAGWLFADYRNRFDGTDKNIIIYGHSMKDESMFGSMYKLFNNDWLNDESNRQIIFNTLDGDNIYQIFSMYRIEAEDYYITTEFSSENEFEEFLHTLKNRSVRNFGVEVAQDSQILTLSTCTTDLNKRIVIHAKKI